MRWIHELTNIIKPGTIIIGLILLIAANIGMNYFILRPYENTVQNSKLKMKQLTDTHFQFRSSTKMDSLMEFYKAEVEYLSQKETELFSHPVAIEEIAIFMSKLEREGSRAGLNVKGSKDNYKSSDNFKTVAITLNIGGNFQQILKFLRVLASWDEVALISDFYLAKDARMSSRLSGHVRLISVVK